jgi:hypothetical protein
LTGWGQSLDGTDRITDRKIDRINRIDRIADREIDRINRIDRIVGQSLELKTTVCPEWHELNPILSTTSCTIIPYIVYSP